MISISLTSFFFFFNDTATTEIYTLSLHDALPICTPQGGIISPILANIYLDRLDKYVEETLMPENIRRSEEHTSELQSRLHLVCRLLLEKKKKNTTEKNKTQST